MATETLEGTLEKFVWKEPAGPFAIARLRPTGGGPHVSIIGSLGNMQISTALRLHGSWEEDRKWGRQFRFTSYQTISPATLGGIERYLGSGMIPGVGPELAARIVKHFGLQTLEIIHKDPDRLTEVDGVGKVRAARIKEKWKEQREVEDVMVFLQGHGVSPAFAWRIYKKYGGDAIALVSENPYRLALDVWGIGFKSADAIAQRLGIDRQSPARAEAGLLHVLGEFTEEGHMHAPEHELLRAGREALGVEDDLLVPAVDRLIADRRLVREDLGDRGPCLSLKRMWEAETGAAEALRKLLGAPRPPVPAAEIAEAIGHFEEDRGFTLASHQRDAVRAAVNEKVVVITGGPGVGKTTIVNAVIRILERQGRRVALGAPTGRAAKRLGETTGREAATLHRLLEFSPQTGGFARGPDLPLAADAVIVDEASMLDTPLAARLFSAVPPHAQLILVGDVDQLPSVGPGRVLHDIIASRTATVSRLNEIFRQAQRSAIVVGAHRVNEGQLPDLEKRDKSDFFFIAREAPGDVVATILEVVAERIPKAFGIEPTDIQVLCPMHRGEVGVQNLNQALQARLNPPRGEGAELTHGKRVFRTGDRVMQNRNDYDKDVWNGDIGKVAAIVSGDEGRQLIVEIDGRSVTYETSELDQLGHAFAMSVHKAQGSEYPAVVVPIVTQHFMMLKRNLLYTAMTRGKKLVVLIGSRKAIGIAVRTDDTRMRWTWLAERLREP